MLRFLGVALVLLGLTAAYADDFPAPGMGLGIRALINKAIVGGTIDNDTIGGVTPAPGTFTVLKGQAGNGASNIRAAGLLTAQLTPTGNGADTTEDTLQTFSFPANTFDAIGRCIKIEAWGSFAANSDTKTVRVYFGVAFYNSTGLTSSGSSWYIWARVCKTGSNTQTSIATGIFANTLPVTNIGSPGQTDTSAITIKVTGQAGTGNASDIVANGMTVTMEN